MSHPAVFQHSPQGRLLSIHDVENDHSSIHQGPTGARAITSILAPTSAYTSAFDSIAVGKGVALKQERSDTSGGINAGQSKNKNPMKFLSG